jgi:NitT/TauT family transport system substrate-binding protein
MGGLRGKTVVAASLMMLMVLAGCTGTTEPAATGEDEGAAAEPGSTEEEAGAGGEAVTDLNVLLSSSALSATYYPWYIAVEQGYVEQEGLTIEFTTGPGSGNAVQQLLANNADVAIATPGAVISAAAQDFDMRYLMEHWYAAQFNILVPEESPIQDFSELNGQNIGIPELSGSEVLVTQAALATEGWTEGIDVRLTVVGEGPTMLRALQDGDVAAVASNLPNELQLEEGLGYALRRITPEEVQFHGDALVVRADTYEDPNYRDALVGLVRATIKGRLWAEANPDDAYEVVKAEYAQEQLGDPGDDSYGRPYFDELLTLTTPPDSVEGYGYFEPGATQAVADSLFELEQIEAEVDTSELIVDDIVAEAWEEIDPEAVQAEPRNF